MERKLLISPKGTKCLDLTNQKFNNLTAISPIWDKRCSDGTILWKCKCDCGSIVDAGSTDIRRGNVRSCGCVKGQAEKRIIDLKNQKFGKLTVLRRTTKEEGGKKIKSWMCQCECGKLHVASQRHLLCGSVSSCGCFRKNPINRNPDRKEAMLALLFHSLVKARNREKNVSSDINFEAFKKLVSSNCHYCDREPSNFARDLYRGKLISNEVVMYNGLDQIVPSAGYIHGNVVPCCFICNAAKGTLLKEEFLIQIKKWSKKFAPIFDSLDDDFEYRSRYKSVDTDNEKSKSFVSDEERKFFKRKVFLLGEFEPSI